MSLGVLMQAQFDRGDIDAARQTAKSLIGNPAYEMKSHVAETMVRLGQGHAAVELSLTPNNAKSDLAYRVFAAAIKYQKATTAAEMLDHFPPSMDARTDAKTQRDEHAAQLVELYARMNQPADAKKLLASVTPPTEPCSPEFDAHRSASRSIAAAKRRAGDPSAGEVLRKPLQEALDRATGAMLLLFDIRTGNIAAAEQDINSADPSLTRSAAFVIAGGITDSPADAISGTSTITDLHRARSLVHLMCTTIDRPAIEMVMFPTARAHVAQN